MNKGKKMKATIKYLVLASAFVSLSATAEQVFLEDFQDANANGWTMSGNGGNLVTVYAGNYSLRLTRARTATQSVSTAGYSNVNVSIEMAASSLEGSDKCIGEVSSNGGTSWQTVVQVVDGQDNGVTLYSGSYSNVALDDNSALQVRVRAAGNWTNDYCWADNISITGEQQTSLYDSLNGTGNVSRSAMTYSTLFSGYTSLTDFSAFAVPAQAKNPTHQFSGELELLNESTTGNLVEQGTSLAGSYTDPEHLPEFSFEFVQHGTHIIPVERGLIATSHPAWSYIIEPGRVWQENSDNNYSRVALPFALQENGANCTHNGVMTFLFKDDGSVSNVAYQIASETCAYFKFNSWGILGAQYSPYAVTGAQQLQVDYEAEVASRMPVKPVSELDNDYPAANLQVSVIGSEQSAAHSSAFGVVVDGTHYTGGCETRYGSYPYCDVMALPSYSTAKSVVGGIGLMRLEHKYAGSQKDVSVANWVSSCGGSQWSDVTLEDALDMATGNYDSDAFQADEASTAMLNGFFLTYTDSQKSSFSCSYSRKATPGTKWVYHTTDTYILGKGINALYQAWEGSGAEFYADMLVEELWKPLDLSPVTYTTLRTFDTEAQAYTGYGLTYHRDDVVKLAEFLNKDDGKINSVTMLDPTLLADAMQQTSNRGLDAGSSIDKYQNGFWGWNAKQALSCSNDTWIPYMSGYGGIGIVMLPGDINYYFFSDNHEHTFVNTVIELNKIYNFCS